MYVKFCIGKFGFEGLKSVVHCEKTSSSLGGDANDVEIVKKKIVMIRVWIVRDFILFASLYHPLLLNMVSKRGLHFL